MVTKGTLSYDKTPNGVLEPESTALLECDVGCSPIAENLAVCQENGVWSKELACQCDVYKI